MLGCQPALNNTASSHFLFAVARTGPRAGCNRQLQRPGRLPRHQLGEFFGAAETDRHLGNDLVVHMQHNRIASGLNAQHRFGEQIAGDAGNDVFGPQAAISAVAVRQSSN